MNAFETTTKANIATRVRAIVAEHFDVDVEKIGDRSRFIDDLKADSLDTMEMIMAIEDEFGLEISDEVAERIRTVGDAIALAEQASRAEINPATQGVGIEQAEA